MGALVGAAVWVADGDGTGVDVGFVVGGTVGFAVGVAVGIGVRSDHAPQPSRLHTWYMIPSFSSIVHSVSKSCPKAAVNSAFV